LNYILPKNKNAWVFLSIPDFSDNPRALFEYVRREYPNISFSWIVEGYEICTRLKESGIDVIRKDSVKGLFTFFRSKVVITSHANLSSIKSGRQLFINLWHGIPLKSIGYMDLEEKDSQNRNLNKNNIVTTSTSATVNTIFGGCYHLNALFLSVTGFPRNDNLFNPVTEEELSTLLNRGTRKFLNIIMYMPTFRQGYLNRSEGEQLKIDNIFRMVGFNNEGFNKFLEREKILFICKLHPFEEKLFKGQLDKIKENYVLLTNDSLNKHNVELYRVLASSNLLVTDYSSVYFDYLLLKRPIIFTPTDLEEYQRKRGFLLEPYDFWTPGPKAVTQESLQVEILKSLNNPGYFRKERDTINDIINHYKDNRSCERVTNLIMEKLKTKVK